MSKEFVKRPDFIKNKTALGVGAAITPAYGLSLHQRGSSKIIQAENAKPGSDDWQLVRARLDADGHRTPWIEGYCNKQSVEAGEKLDIMVSTDPIREFTLEIFRTGY